ncbi:MAG: ABC transporter ATP-binding protein/permease [bacterium]|nr:ABC transporter ATP-binding protein/permease [bacterium]
MKTEAKNFSWLDVPKSVWYFLEEDKKKFAFYLTALLVAFFYDLVPVYIVGKMVDFFTTYQTGQSLYPFYFYIVFVSVTWLVFGVTRVYLRGSLGAIAVSARARARTWGFERLTEFSLEWHNKENVGNKLQRIFTGADAITRLLRVLRADLLRIFANVFGAIAFFLFTDAKFVVVVVGFTVAFLFIEFNFNKKILALSNEFNKLNQRAGGALVESANNMLSIKALGSEKTVANRVLDKEAMSRDVSIKKIHIINFKWVLMHVLSASTLLVFLYFIGTSVIGGIITIGTVLVFFTYFYRLQGYLSDISNLNMELIELKSDLGQMMPIFRETEFIKTGNESFPKDWQEITLKNVSMDYGSGQTGLQNFNLTLPKNTKTGIAGVSGSGKSTLAKIMLGLYALGSGEFKIGNKSYYSISHNDTLDNIAVVLQETELFNLSLRNNITMMRQEDTELLNKAIEIAELADVIDRLPEGLDARIGEKGYMLSGGERQRLGIARAVYKNAPIMLLDEATSSLDSETEGKIMDKLLRTYGQNKTFLIIAHRLGTLKYTDKIAVMERGAIMEEGTYEELMKDSASVFYRLNQEHTLPS